LRSTNVVTLAGTGAGAGAGAGAAAGADTPAAADTGTQFAAHYRKWADAQKVTMRQVHVAGDKVFVDYSGRRPWIVDAKTGERIEVELFVAVLGASNYTFAEASLTQRSRDWIESQLRMLEFFGGVPRAIVPDQLKVISDNYLCRWARPSLKAPISMFQLHNNSNSAVARGV
jgi:hypothetical protein